MFRVLMEEKQLPELPAKIDHVSYLDGSKVYFETAEGHCEIFREPSPLIRIFCEMPTPEEAGGDL